MFDKFYTDTQLFEIYGVEHWVSLAVSAVLGCGLFAYAKGKSMENRRKIALITLGFIYFTQIFKLFIRLYLGNFDMQEDLPLHLCNLLPLFLLIAIYLKSRAGFGIVFFWIMAGTIQANITPSLRDVFPHYEAIRYWVIHMGLPIMAVYGVFLLKYRLKWSDVVLSALSLNLLAAPIYAFNYLTNSNYLYLQAKPYGDTIYNFLGPWPWYILSIEVVMLFLFSLVALPFMMFQRRNP